MSNGEITWEQKQIADLSSLGIRQNERMLEYEDQLAAVSAERDEARRWAARWKRLAFAYSYNTNLGWDQVRKNDYWRQYERRTR